MSLKANKVYYLASPYTHTNMFIKNLYYELVVYAGALLTHKGLTLIEPIAQCHHQSSKYGLPTGYAFWKDRDREFIARSDGIIVLKLLGWEESVGVSDEIRYATALEKDVYLLSPEDIYPKEVLEVVKTIVAN